MAVVKINGKEYQGIDKVKIGDSDGKVALTMMESSGKADSYVFNAIRLRIEAKGNIKSARVYNCVYIKGDIKNADVHNLLMVEGFVQNYTNYRGIQVRRDINIDKEIERTTKTGYNNKARATVVHINGYLSLLTIDMTRMQTVPIIDGNVLELSCGNCAFVKGTVQNCNVGNSIQATMGTKVSDVEKKHRKDLEARNKQAERDLNKALSDIFKMGDK